MCSPVQKLLKRHTTAKRTRVERMRRLYKAAGDSCCRSVCVCSFRDPTSPQFLLCVPLDPLTPQTPAAALGPDEQEHWEREMDELLEWTHSLSFKELDDLLHAHI